MPPINESLDNMVVRSSIDPGLGLVVPESHRSNITADTIATLPIVTGVRRTIDGMRERRNKRLDDIDKELEEAIEAAKMQHELKRRKVLKEFETTVRCISKDIIDPYTREHRVAKAALVIGEFVENVQSPETCTLCLDSITSNALRLHGCGHIFHCNDECVCLLLGRSTCPNCRSHYKSIKPL